MSAARATISAGDGLLGELNTAVLLGAEVRDALDLGTAVTAGGALGELLAVLDDEATA